MRDRGSSSVKSGASGRALRFTAQRRPTSTITAVLAKQHMSIARRRELESARNQCAQNELAYHACPALTAGDAACGARWECDILVDPAEVPESPDPLRRFRSANSGWNPHRRGT